MAPMIESLICAVHIAPNRMRLSQTGWQRLRSTQTKLTFLG